MRHLPAGTNDPVGRTRLIASVTARVLEGQAVAVHGPRGMGRSTFLAAVAAGVPHAISVRMQRRGVPGNGVSLIAAGFPQATLDELPERMRSLLLDPRSLPAHDPRERLGDALTELLTAQAAAAPFVLVIDDAQHIDALSLAALRTAASRSLGPGTFGALAAVGPAEIDPATGHPRTVAARELSLLHVDLLPFAAADTVELLAAEGVPTDTALWAHRESGGNPGLARDIAAAVDGLTPELAARELGSLARERVHELSAPVRQTLRRVAAMHQPTTATLRRLGGETAAESIRAARALGLVVTEDEYLRLTPEVLGDVLLESVDSDELIALHRELAAHADSEGLTRYHLALAGDTGTTPADLATAATGCASRGEHDLAAQLYLLAADAGTPERDEWLTLSLENAVIGKETRVLHRATRAAADLTEPSLSVRAKLALVELGDPAPDEVLVAALHESRADPTLQARVLLQRARLLLGSQDLRAALDVAGRAVELARRAGRTDLEVDALTVGAAAGRTLGDPDALRLIKRAAEIAGDPRPGQVHTSARYVAARFSLHDDDLRRARAAFGDMLTDVGPDAGLDTVHVLRSLVEVVARQGRGREALELAGRATRAATHFDTPMATTWFIEAIAESVGGTFERTRTVSARGVDLARSERDQRYLRRHLGYLGLALLHLDDPEGAVAAHRELRRIDADSGIRDLTSVRWHTDAVMALVAIGATDEAEGLLAEVRAALEDGLGAPGVAAAADRAAAEIAAARGDLDTARTLAARSIAAAEECRLPIELARSLVTLAHIERRARRGGRSREAAARAREVLRPLHAVPWAEWVQMRFPEGAALHTLEIEEPDTTDPHTTLSMLTLTEQQVAGLVAEGASNREIAQRLHLSVKTVEGGLTRIYRKTGVRSRTQLATLVLGHGPR
ncbi:LuxR C-terminal-related transcriptional regulator [Janibacter cremeus]|uniref:DNA-binding CsgD family transcriptional regulator/energy-coupling factor transporter ATP-binding protein EcfA2 n=1 Tax=Janibacter cremeus TaxID=1285192 RepID=A0A852VUS9_9MICO|nr:DNA-binding CsgD family transcriptional regulator/energy-coupling factor transporter ATP-binding protein EcfA2 [Janibacter cremeus]